MPIKPPVGTRNPPRLGPPSLNGKSTVALICSFIPLLGSIPAILLGRSALKEIKEKHEKGEKRAFVAIALGFAWPLMAILTAGIILILFKTGLWTQFGVSPTYQNPSYHYSIDYPAGWHLLNPKNQANVTMEAQSPHKDAAILITTLPKAGGGTDLYAQNLSTNLATANCSLCGKPTTNKVTISAGPAISVSGYAVDPNTKQTVYTITFLIKDSKGNLYEITILEDPNHYPDPNSDALNIVNTFHLPS